ncbi:MAG: efflux RND transporter permease subunit [Gemmatimonadota bacterium]|nr:MAG: efflux RND transporter permease subunit [Gemmatimonadota bacterium]
MNIPDFTIRRPITTVMILVSLVVIGAVSISRLPLEFLPNVEFPGLFIYTPYPNSTPNEVEQNITVPIEEAIGTMSGIRRIESYSGDDFSQVNVFFDYGKSMNILGVEAREKIDRVMNELPDDIDRVFIYRFSATDIPVLQMRISSERDLSNAYDTLDRLLKRRLERVDGVSRVDLYGVEKSEIFIDLKVDKLKAYNVDVGRLLTTLRNNNFSLSVGDVIDGGKKYAVRAIGKYGSLDDVENIIVTGRGVKLKEIADVELASPTLTYGRHLNRNYAIGLDIYKESGRNTVEIARKARTVIEDVGNEPEMRGINLWFFLDQSEEIIDSLNEVKKAGIYGAILAIFVLFFFLRKVRTTLIVAVAIPFSIITALTFLKIFNVTLNVLSMTGLMLGVGMLVDNSVVVAESIFRHKQQGESAKDATTLGVKEVGTAILAATLTSTIVFVPIIFGRKDDLTVWLKDFALAISFTLLCSLFIAMTFIPLTTSRFLKGEIKEKSKFIRKVTKKYVRILGWTVQSTKRALLVFFLALICLAGTCGGPYKFMSKDEVVRSAQRYIRIRYFIDENFTLNTVERMVDRVEEFLLEDKERFEIESVYSYYQRDYAMTSVKLIDWRAGSREVPEIMEDIRTGLPKLPGVRLVMGRQQQTGGGEITVSVRLQGDNSEVLSGIAREVERRLERIPGLADVQTDDEAGDEEIQIVVDRERAKNFGISAQQVAQTVSGTLRGTRLSRFKDVEGEIEMNLQLQASDRKDVRSLEKINLISTSGEPVSLKSVADLIVRKGPRTIRREDRRTTTTVYANLQATDLGRLRGEIFQQMATLEMPPGYSWSLGQRFEREEEQQSQMLWNYIMAIILIYLLMASLFESLVHPLTILTALPFAFVGVVWFLFLTHTPLTIMARIAILVLVGIVVNNGIVLLDYINQLRRKGVPREEAIVRGGENRFRPIVMTAATTILGLAPMAWGKAQLLGGLMYYPMARAIMGGLAVSTVLTLLVTPSIYLLLDKLKVHTVGIFSAVRSKK